jgi:phosphoribosylaminoimidazolecarboxamide formyltransferase / IMP cyclohydrolase
VCPKEIKLRYGCNSHQVPARVYAKSGELPIRVQSGAPGYINLLDALNSWQLVRELKQIFGQPAAASFKHVSPAGAALGIPLSDELKQAFFVKTLELSPLASAYARARGADRVASFGDWAALSDPVDVPTAQLIHREVSDGVIAPGYEPEALKILKEKKNGKYVVLEIDPKYEPEDLETREVFGIRFEQKRNSLLAHPDQLQNIVTQKKDLPEAGRKDMLLALTALKYTQSNSVCLAYEGQIIGMGAGQQSRIHCTRLAANKADAWFLRQHPLVLGMQFVEGIHRPERDNAIDAYLRDDLSSAEETAWRENFEVAPLRLTLDRKREWLDRQSGVVLGSDAFFPFRDNIDRARESGVSYVVQPGGSVRDEDVIQACDEYEMVMAFTGVRLFHH